MADLRELAADVPHPQPGGQPSQTLHFLLRGICHSQGGPRNHLLNSPQQSLLEERNLRSGQHLLLQLAVQIGHQTPDPLPVSGFGPVGRPPLVQLNIHPIQPPTTLQLLRQRPPDLRRHPQDPSHHLEIQKHQSDPIWAKLPAEGSQLSGNDQRVQRGSQEGGAEGGVCARFGGGEEDCQTA